MSEPTPSKVIKVWFSEIYNNKIPIYGKIMVKWPVLLNL
tara:strand:+ start:220 stop:336 length:117 start_codon:yes stop_codon:yes gene_type:complete